MAKYLLLALVGVGIAVWILGWVLNPGDDESVTGPEQVPAATAKVEPLLEGHVEAAIWQADEARPAWVDSMATTEGANVSRLAELMSAKVVTAMGVKPARLFVDQASWSGLDELERTTIGQMALALANAASGSSQTALIVLPSSMVDTPQDEWKPLAEISAP